jgi:hypothetical protein
MTTESLEVRMARLEGSYEQINERLGTIETRLDPVTIVEFSDFQCPFCARVHGTLERLLANNPQTVRLIYVQYPLPNHQWARPASMAALCAAQQDDEAFWTLHDRYFEHQREMTPQNVVERSRNVAAAVSTSCPYSACAETTIPSRPLGGETPFTSTWRVRWTMPGMRSAKVTPATSASPSRRRPSSRYVRSNRDRRKPARVS